MLVLSLSESPSNSLSSYPDNWEEGILPDNYDVGFDDIACDSFFVPKTPDLLDYWDILL